MQKIVLAAESFLVSLLDGSLDIYVGAFNIKTSRPDPTNVVPFEARWNECTQDNGLGHMAFIQFRTMPTN